MNPPNDITLQEVVSLSPGLAFNDGGVHQSAKSGRPHCCSMSRGEVATLVCASATEPVGLSTMAADVMPVSDVSVTVAVESSIIAQELPMLPSSSVFNTQKSE